VEFGAARGADVSAPAPLSPSFRRKPEPILPLLFDSTARSKIKMGCGFRRNDGV